MTETTDPIVAGPAGGVTAALDDAYERMAAAGFETRNGYVNHGPMACEALAVMGFEVELDAWARRAAARRCPA